MKASELVYKLLFIQCGGAAQKSVRNHENDARNAGPDGGPAGHLSNVYLFDAETIARIHPDHGADPDGEEVCYACRHKARHTGHCAVRDASAAKSEQCRLEYFEPDIAQVIARYYELDGKPYVLELIKRTSGSAVMEMKAGGGLLVELSGYHNKLYHDPLTNTYNRRYYEEAVRSMIGPAGVAVMDLDDFKIYNDTYGHHAGDLVLETVARVVRSCIRQTDMLIRYGGDEFLLLLPGIPAEQLQPRLEKICGQVNQAVIPGYAHLRPTVSIGGVMQTITDPIEMAVRKADRLMYQAKNHKNSVVVAGPEDVPLSTAAEAARQKEKQLILIMDDSEMNRAILTEILQQDYRILEAANGAEALEKMNEYSGEIALVLLDLIMPVMDGFEVLDYMNRNHTIEDIPVIMISSEDSEESIRYAYEMGASDYVNRPFDSRVVYRRVYNTIKLYAKQRRLVSMVSDQIRKQEKNTSMLVGVFSQIVEFRNGESDQHVQNIRLFTEMLLERLMEKTQAYHIPAEEQDNIPLASALHDIGKIAIDETILNKPGRLTKEEFELVKTHTTQGAAMLHRLENFKEEPLLQTAYQIARWHHERWDGCGYPDGLKENEIPIAAQIVSLADAYDALTSEWCYKKAFSHDTAVQMILHDECGIFNPLLIECMLDIQDNLREALHKKCG